MSSDRPSRQTFRQDDPHEAHGDVANRQDNRDAGETTKAIRDIGETVAAQVGTPSLPVRPKHRPRPSRPS
jgi:hypothetical protein